uniref:Uncharacterized protein n=1 Tax=Lygus hesperus TaxID=30085 RepID=A0A0A9YZ52_LYGHE
MKKSTWKKLFTRSKSKSGTRASKKAKQTLVSCNVCAGVALINVETLCSTHRNIPINKNQAGSPKDAASTGQSTPSPGPPAATSESKNAVEVNDKLTEPTASVNPAQENLKVQESGLEKSAPVDISNPQPLRRSSTNEEFMTEEVESHNLSDTSRTGENLERVGEEIENNSRSTTSNNDMTASSLTQELKKFAVESKAPSGARGFIIRSGIQVRDSESRDSEVPFLTLENQLSDEAPLQEAPLEEQETPAGPQGTPAEAQRSSSSQHGLKIPSSAKISSAEKIVLSSDLKVESVFDKSLVGASEEQNVEAKNRKNSMSSADVALNSIVLGVASQSRRESQSSGRPVEAASSNNVEFMSEEVKMGSGTSAEVDDAYYPKSSPQVSSAVNITEQDPSSSSQQESNSSSNQGLQIVEVDDQGAPQESRRLSTDESIINNIGNNKTPNLVKGMSTDSSEDLKPGMLQAQRSSKLNISFSEHLSLLGDAKGNDGGFSHDSLESAGDTTEVTTIETTTVIMGEVPEGPFDAPSGGEGIMPTSGNESEEALLPPPEDDTTMEGDSGMGSEDSRTTGPNETTEETAIHANTVHNARPTPPIIFGSMSGPEPENEWSQPLFFGPNALAQGLTLNVGRDRETQQRADAPFQGFGIISIMRDLYENDSSASQVNKVTDVTEEKKKEEEAEEESGESGQAPPSLDDEDQEQDSFKEVPKKQE